MHFNERPYLNHKCYLFLTKTTRERMRQQSNFSTLCRGHIVPKEIQDRETAVKFMEAVEQFARIMNDSGHIRLRRLSDDEIAGTEKETGIIGRYLTLSLGNTNCLEDIAMSAEGMRVGSNRLCLHTLSDTEDLPASVETDYRYERLSTDRSDCRLSFAAPLGLLLPCNHIYNQYVFVGNSDEEPAPLREVGQEHAVALALQPPERHQLRVDRGIPERGSLAGTEIRPRPLQRDGVERRRGGAETDIGTTWGASWQAWMCAPPQHDGLPDAVLGGHTGQCGGLPGRGIVPHVYRAGGMPVRRRDQLPGLALGFRHPMADRISGKPLHIDISDLPMKRGIITNRNKFVLGPSGSGKSFFMNHLVRQYYEQGTHVVLVDTGNSYQGLCEMIHRRTHGQDGIYFTYTEEKPISFNPFYTDDGVFDVEKKDSIKTLLLTLWKSENEPATKTETAELGSAVNAYILKLQQDRSIAPSFNTFYEYLRDVYRKEMEERYIKVEKSDFNIDNLLTTLRQYYRGGRYDFLLNSAENIDLLHKRFVVFEIDAVKDNAELFPVVTIIIMEAFINKMRRLKGVRKQLICEEAWKALSSANMASYLQYLYKTVRKYFGEAIVVTQEVDDIISSPIVKESIINNSDCKILLDQRKYMNRFDQIQSLLGLTEKEKSQILSINQSNDPARRYKEVWIGLGGTHSAVYATEVSMHEYLAYTTEETEKMEVRELAEKLGGDMEAAIRKVAERRKEEWTGQ